MAFSGRPACRPISAPRARRAAAGCSRRAARRTASRAPWARAGSSSRVDVAGPGGTGPGLALQVERTSWAPTLRPPTSSPSRQADAEPTLLVRGSPRHADVAPAERVTPQRATRSDPLGSPRRSVACQAGVLCQDGVSSYLRSQVGPARPTTRRASRPRLAESLCSPRRATRSWPVGLAATFCHLPRWCALPGWRLQLLRLASRTCSSDHQMGQPASARRVTVFSSACDALLACWARRDVPSLAKLG